ncbi:MAG: arginine--tRNA ligase, partial [Sphaerochaetaceae bacterium]|nr:arginine--tRNA ligase [Sphaerochaetaceae bacterium]
MLEKIRSRWKLLVERELVAYAKEQGISTKEVESASLVVQSPPKSELGDIAFPFFSYAKSFRIAPPVLVQHIRIRMEKRDDLPNGMLLAAGPYLNVKIDMAALAEATAAAVENHKERYGHNDSLAHKRIMVEFSCPNTNKPLHLGHLRNDAIGQSVAAILKANGADVRKVNLINNRGVHICKSMLAYQKFSQGET